MSPHTIEATEGRGYLPAMRDPHARPKAPRARPASPPSPPAEQPEKRRGGRRRNPEAVRDLPGVTVRAEPALLARLDAIVTRRNAASREQGYTTSRGAVMVIALREFCEREETAHPPAGE
jgi:hypothetical protein